VVHHQALVLAPPKWLHLTARKLLRGFFRRSGDSIIVQAGPAWGGGMFGGTATAMVIPTHRPQKEQIAWLLEQVTAIRNDVGQTRQQIRREQSERNRVVGQLEQRVDEMEREAQ
jgi:hypothetical protein